MYVKAVIFDLDGVITSTSEEHFLAWTKLAKEFGRELSPGVFHAVKGISRLESLDIVLGDIGMEKRFTQAEKLCLADRKNAIYVDMISRFDESNLAEGAAELLRLLKKNDIKIALGSVSKNSCMLLKNMKIYDCFDYIVDPSAVKHAKPAPDIFLDAARHFSFNPKYCAGVEDAAAGVQAIKAAGMFAVGIGDKDYLWQADIVYSELKGLDIYEIDEAMSRKESNRQ